ncbi:Cytochrome-P450 52A13 [Teratosphaeria destructans]|uniref:Cytochrome-P450 52A13 n=1 Tax=Teratosphaeria destructans TaxID=418781 RepID=A0A9W7W026_9PEZI|nr:Cytochrome-P450 52A13 [Teratosphaeria destructans]
MSTVSFGAFSAAESVNSGNKIDDNYTSVTSVEIPVTASNLHKIGCAFGSYTGSPNQIFVAAIRPTVFADWNLQDVMEGNRSALLPYIIVGLWLVRAIIKLCLNVRSTRRFQRFAASQNCGNATALPKPLGGNLRHKLRLLTYRGGDLLDGLFAAKYKKYGPTHALHDAFGKPMVIHTIDPANLNAVLSTSWKDWRPSKNRTNTLKPLAQDGLLLTEGDIWHRKRKLISRHLGTKRAKDTSREEVHIQTLFEAIGNVDHDGWTDEVDLVDLLHRFALDTSTAFLLGKGAESQRSGMREKQRQAAMKDFDLVPGQSTTEMSYDQAYETIRQYLSRRSKLGSLYWIADGIDYRRACATMNRYADDLVIQAMAEASSDVLANADTRVKGDFGLISDLKQELEDPTEIRNLVMDLFIAGQNMTGTLAAWIFAQLEQHPDIYQRMRAEVADAFGDEHSPKVPVTWDEMKKCQTLQNVILETLRMYPLLANIGRTARVDTILPHGGGPDGLQPLAVPAGAAVTCNLYLMHRRQEEWGDDAWEFNPDRWIGRKFGAEYAPFGLGPRVCVGFQMAKTELSYLCIRMVQRFSEIKAPEGQDNLAKGYRVVVAPANGVKATEIGRVRSSVRRDPGRAACFDTTISFVCDIVNSAELEIKKPSMSTGLLQEALQQLKDQRPALDNLLESPYTAVMPPTPPSESYTVAALQHQGSSVSLMPPFQPSTGLTPGGDNRCWLEPPPEYSPPTHGSVVPGEKAEKQQPEVEPPEPQNQPAEEVFDTDALYNSITTNDLALMNDLLTLGADPNAAVGELQRTALHQAAHLNHTACLASLLRNGAGMSTEDSKGDTPLHLAAWAGHCEALDALLAHGADVDWLSGRDAYSPLWCAISAGHIDAVRLLLKHGARVSLKAEGGLVPLHQAAVTGQSAMCELLLDRGAQSDSVDENDQTALAYAAASGSVPTVRVLLKHGANVEAAQTQGLTPAHWAAHKGHAEVLALLIAYGAKINARTLGGAAPLHLAANRGHAKATRLLLEKGADPKLVAGEWDGVSGIPAQMARAKGHMRLAASITSS